MLIPGLAYIFSKKAGTLERLDYRTFTTAEVDTIVDLLKALNDDKAMIVENGKSRVLTNQDRTMIRQYLDNVIIYDTDLNSDFHFQMSTTKAEDKFKRINFGTDFLSAEELKEKDSPKLQLFRQFLLNKYHSVKFELADSDADFTEVTFEKGKVHTKVWKSTEGGYRAFLLSLRNGNVPKLTGTVKPAVKSENPVDELLNPAYINQKFNLNPVEEKKKPVQQPAQKEEKKETKPAEKKWGVLKSGTWYTVKMLDRENKPKVSNGLRIMWDGTKVNIEGSAEQSNLVNTFAKTMEKMYTEAVSHQMSIAELMRAEKTDPDGTIKGGIIVDFIEDAPKAPVASKEPQRLTSVLTEEENKILDAFNATVRTPLTAEEAMAAKGIMIRAGKYTLQELLESMHHSKYPGEVSIVKQETQVPDAQVQPVEDEDDLTIMRRENLPEETLEDTAGQFAYLKALFPDFDIQRAQLEGLTGGMVVDSMKLMLSTRAAIGTAYHEAYHAVSLAFMSQKKRERLYNETRTRLNRPEMTDKEAEEFLAEEFRIFKLSDGHYSFPEGSKEKRGWFRQLLDYLMSLLKKLGWVDSIENTFKTLDAHPYYIKNRKSNVQGTYNRDGKISEATKNALLDHLNNRFFNHVFKDADVNYTKLTSHDNGLTDIYNNIHKGLVNILLKNNGVLDNRTMIADLMLGNWDELSGYMLNSFVRTGLRLRLQKENRKILKRILP
jgi:hypothetical protein